MKDGFWYQVSLRVVPAVFVWLTRLWFCTCRIVTHGQQYRAQIDARKGPAVGCFWHYSILFIFYYLRKETAVAMVSGSRDGEYISRMAQRMGHATVRGSRKKGGLTAIKGMIRHMREGKHAAIVADGSQGPPRVVQAGCIVLASHTGFPVVPMVWSCNRYIRFGSWDGTVMPYPFSRIDYFYGEPFDVPPKLDSAELEKYRLLLEERLNRLYEEAWALHGKTEH